MRVAVFGGPGNDPKRTRRNAVPAAVADVRLDIHVAVLVVDKRSCRAGLHARRVNAVLADIAHHQPAAAVFANLLLERHMPPSCRRQMLGVVVTFRRKIVAIRRQLIPLLAGHFAGFAADTQAGIGEKSHLVLSIRPRTRNICPLRRERISNACRRIGSQHF